MPAALSTYIGINYYHPDLIINIGTAGGCKNKQVKLKDIFISRTIYCYDKRMSSPVYHKYALGIYTSTKINTANTHLQKGIVCTGDSLDMSITDKKMIDKLGCDVVDMEAAGVAWVSRLFKIPMVALKGVTDLAGEKDSFQQFKLNSPTVIQLLTHELKVILAQNI